MKDFPSAFNCPPVTWACGFWMEAITKYMCASDFSGYGKTWKQAGAEFGQAQQLFFKFGVGLVFAVKDRLSLRYGSVRNLLLKHNPKRI